MPKREESGKILLVANTDWYLYNFRLSLARALTAAGHAVVLVSPDGPYAQRLRDAGYCWRNWPVGRKSTNPLAEIKAIMQLRRIYTSEHPVLVHHFTVKPVLYGSLAARAGAAPAVVNGITGLGYVFLENGIKGRVLRRIVLGLYRLAFSHPRMGVIFENTHDEQFFTQRGLVKSEKGRVIEGVGVDVDWFTPAPEPGGTPLVVLPARMLWDKGVGVLVEAARRLPPGLARIVLVGGTDPGNPASIPEETLHGWVKEGIVEWWGFQEDMRSVYQQAAVVTLPSMGEGLPTVLIEAAACGKPIVATNVPGCREVVADQVSGALVPPNDPVALAAALEGLLKDTARRTQWGAVGRERAVNLFSDHRVNAETMAFYRQVLSQ